MPIVHTFFYILFFYTALVTLYLTAFGVAGRFRRPLLRIEPQRFRRMVVFLPAYREDAVIVDSTQRALNQAYPADAYTVVVIADSLEAATLARLRQFPVQVVEVSFAVSTKANALNAVLAQLPTDAYDVAVVLDADNVMAPDFLARLNEAFEQGWRAVQGHRVAKNTNTPTALLDAVSEEINNHIFRQGHRALGLSAGLIGSGMAFEYGLFRELMTHVRTTGGFDRALEMRLLRMGIGIEYRIDALCYDEKVQNPAVFERQRTRWMAAQLKYLRQNLLPGIAHLLRGNVDYFDKVLQTLLPPRLILLGMLVLGVVVALVLRQPELILLSAGQLALLLFTFAISTPAALRTRLTWREIGQLPVLFWRFLRTFTKLSDDGKRFIHTPHNITSDHAG